MRRISPSLLPNRVTVQRQGAWSYDDAGGRVPHPGAASAPIRCSVQPTDAKEVADHLRDEAETFFTIYFDADPGLNIRDLVNLMDVSPPRVLYVLAKQQDLVTVGNTYKVLCGERT
jgi:hypothetical protein